MSEPLLDIENLSVQFDTPEARPWPWTMSPFPWSRARTLGLVGESGCGKSVTSLSVMGLIESPPGRITSGRINFQGRDLLSLNQDEMRTIRGRSISMIFQEPMTSLNPVMTVGRQVAEPLMVTSEAVQGRGLGKGPRAFWTRSASPHPRPGWGITPTSSPAG